MKNYERLLPLRFSQGRNDSEEFGSYFIFRHCEEQSDEAISETLVRLSLFPFAQRPNDRGRFLCDDGTDSDLISVVVPACNEEGFLGKCLESLRCQDCPGDYEFIVVDNGSSDGTAAIARRFGAKVVHEKERGVARARQSGFAAAQGEIIVSTDADTAVPPHWLRQIRQLFAENPEAIAVAGYFLLADGPASARCLMRLSLRLMPYVLKFAPGLWSFGGCNFAVKRSAFVAVGGFNTATKYGEDVDLCRRLRRMGQVVLDPTLVVHTSGRTYWADPLAVRLVLNYFSLLVLGRVLLPVVRGRVRK